MTYRKLPSTKNSKKEVLSGVSFADNIEVDKLNRNYKNEILGVISLIAITLFSITIIDVEDMVVDKLISKAVNNKITNKVKTKAVNYTEEYIQTKDDSFNSILNHNDEINGQFPKKVFRNIIIQIISKVKIISENNNHYPHREIIHSKLNNDLRK